MLIPERPLPHRNADLAFADARVASCRDELYVALGQWPDTPESRVLAAAHRYGAAGRTHRVLVESLLEHLLEQFDDILARANDREGAGRLRDVVIRSLIVGYADDRTIAGA